MPRSAAAKHVFYDLAPTRPDSIREEVLEGMAERPRRLPCKLLYDDLGSVLFDRICTQPEYYVPRAEKAIMEMHMPEMAALVGRCARVMEPGCGSGAKTRFLLENLRDPAAYVAVDIARECLLEWTREVAERFPGLDVVALCADFTRPLELPPLRRPVGRTLVYFPGSTIGNLEPSAAIAFLKRMGTVCGPTGGVLLGVDTRKDVRVLTAAYDDAQGVTAAFNLNMLTRLNRELDADFGLSAFSHRSYYNEAHGRIEMHLVSRRRQVVRLAGNTFTLEADECICTEHSYKYTPLEFARLAARAGMAVTHAWADPEGLFTVQLLRPRNTRGLPATAPLSGLK